MNAILSVLPCAFVVACGFFPDAQAGVLSGSGIYDGAGNDVLIVSNSGTLVAPGSGVAAVGYFGVDDSQVALWAGSGSFPQLTANFVALASDDFATASLSFFGSLIPGAYVVSVDYGLVGMGDPRLGKSLYTFFGNRHTLPGSTELALVLHPGQVIDRDDNMALPDVNYPDLFRPHQLLAGHAGPMVLYDATALGGSTNTPAATIRLSPVPEASPALLGLAGALAFLRRRR